MPKNIPEKSAVVLDHPLIVGGGVVGMVLACALRAMGLAVTVLDGADSADSRQVKTLPSQSNKSPLPYDLRTVALWQGSVQFLRYLGVWDSVVGGDNDDFCPVPLETLRLITPTADGAGVASQVDFGAGDLGLHSLGYNIPVSRLQQALLARCADLGVTIYHNSPVDTVDYDGKRMTVMTAGGQAYTAPVVLATSGRNCPIRTQTNTDMAVHEYDISALVGMVQHSMPHGNTSQEIHHTGGPFTLVPMCDIGCDVGGGALPHMSALVWVDKSGVVGDIADLSESDFNARMQQASLGIAGDMALVGQRQVFPLTCQYAKVMGGAGYVLLGESAHVLPPFAAQGMNLSLRDVADYVYQLQQALKLGRDMGDCAIVQQYQNNRLPDIRARVGAVTTLHNMVFNSNPLLHALRTRGMGLLNTLSPLRHGVMALGMSGFGGDPVLMQQDSGHNHG